MMMMIISGKLTSKDEQVRGWYDYVRSLYPSRYNESIRDNEPGCELRAGTVLASGAVYVEYLATVPMLFVSNNVIVLVHFLSEQEYQY